MNNTPRGLNPGVGGNKTATATEPQSTYFKGISKSDEDKIFEYANNHGANQLERNMIANDLYKRTLEETQRRAFGIDREKAKTEMINKMVTTKDKNESNTISSQLKISDVADIIRADAYNQGYDLSKVGDQQVVDNFMQDNPKYAQQLKSILSGDADIMSFADQLGVIPSEMPNNKETRGGGIRRGAVTEMGETKSKGGGGIRRGAVTEMGETKSKGGGVIDSIVNPIGKLFEWINKQAQKIPTFSGEGLKNKLRERVESLSDEDIAKYKSQWENSDFYKKAYGTFENFVEEREKSFLDTLFGVDLNESEGPNLGKMILNAPGSAVKTATAIAEGVTNPYDTIKGVVKLVSTEEGMKAITDRYGSWDAFQKSVEQDPVGVASDILTLVQGGASVAGKAAKYGSKATSLVGMEKTTAALQELSKNAKNLSKKAGGAADMGLGEVKSNIVPKVLEKGKNSENKLVRGASKVADWSLRNQTDFMGTNAKRINNTTSSAMDSLVGITDNMRKKIADNPEITEYANRVDKRVKEEGAYTEGKEYATEFRNEIANEVESRVNKLKNKLGTDSEIYNQYKNSGDKVNTTSTKEKVDNILKNKDIIVRDVTDKKGNVSKEFDYKDSALNGKSEGLEQIYDYLERHNELSGKEVLTLNEKINNAIGSAKKGSSEYALLTDIKKAIKDDFHGQSEIYKNLDALYEDDIKFLNEVSEGLTNRNGTVKENLNTLIKKVGSNPKWSDKLEKLYPGITKKVEALDVMPKMLDNMYKNDTKFGRIIAGASIFGMLGDAGFTHIVRNVGIGAGLKYAYNKASNKRWQKVLTTMSPEGQKYISELNKKVENGDKFTDKEREAVKELNEMIKNSKKEVSKDKIEKREQKTLF